MPTGVKADPDAHVELSDAVHEVGVMVAQGYDGWAAMRTACDKHFKHHEELKNRRVDKPVNCLLCLAQE